MKIPFCLPIIKNKKADVFKMVRNNIHRYAYFEVWLDYIDDFDDAFIKQLIKLLREKLILLFRRQNLEKVKMELEKRLKVISLQESSQSLIDLDVFDQKEELECIRNNRLAVKTIVSYHDYKETPDNRKLEKIIDTMKIYKPSIFKISTMCNSQQDALRLLQLLLELKQNNLKCIVLLTVAGILPIFSKI